MINLITLYFLFAFLQVATFNLQNFNLKNNYFESKKDNFVELITKSNAAIIALQEIGSKGRLGDPIQSLIDSLNKPNGVKWKYIIGRDSTHRTAIIYDSSKVTTLINGHQGSVETIHLKSLTRGALVVQFKDLNTNEIFKVISAHLKSPIKGAEEVAAINFREIMDFISRRKDETFILLGDMNMNLQKIKKVLQSESIRDMRLNRFFQHAKGPELFRGSQGFLHPLYDHIFVISKRGLERMVRFNSMNYERTSLETSPKTTRFSDHPYLKAFIRFTDSTQDDYRKYLTDIISEYGIVESHTADNPTLRTIEEPEGTQKFKPVDPSGSDQIRTPPLTPHPDVKRPFF
eukprot:NODE_858_length_3488_cov_0.650634.p1 type:complete len:346 gc:universal NODE_858_length_3488_cov_0.650634:1976-939(-)